MTNPKTLTTKSVKIAPAAKKPDTVMLADLCSELKIKPREARMMLRLAISKKGKYPALTENHIPRQPWQHAQKRPQMAAIWRSGRFAQLRRSHPSGALHRLHNRRLHRSGKQRDRPAVAAWSHCSSK